jgi:hypothetical protein
MRTRRLRARLADVMRVDDRARVTYAAAAHMLRQSLTTRKLQVNYLLGSQAHVMRMS